jgi:protein-disulfide isomerase
VFAATFTEVAGEQGKYWEARDLLFAKQREWATQHGATPDPTKPKIDKLFEKYAEELGLDRDKATRSIKERRFEAKIKQDEQDAKELGVRKTPSFFVNGRELVSFGEPELRHLVNEEMNK